MSTLAPLDTLIERKRSGGRFILAIQKSVFKENDPETLIDSLALLGSISRENGTVNISFLSENSRWRFLGKLYQLS